MPSWPLRFFSCCRRCLHFGFALPPEGGTSSAEAPAAASVAQKYPSPSSTLQGADSAAITDRTAPPLRHMATRHLRLPCRLRAVSPLVCAEELPPPLAPSHLLLIMVSGPAEPLVHPLDVLPPRRESHGRDRLRPSLRPALLQPRLPRRYPSRPTATALSRWELLIYDFHPPWRSVRHNGRSGCPRRYCQVTIRGFRRVLFAG